MGMAGEQACIPEPPHVGGDGRLGKSQVGDEVGHSMLSQEQVLHDREPVGVGEGLEQGSGPAVRPGATILSGHPFVPGIAIRQ